VSFFGEFERFFSDYIYPAWPVFLLLAVLGAAAAFVVAYRLGLHRVALRHRFVTAIGIVAVLAVTIPGGYYTISPLFDRNTVCELSPVAGAGAGSERCEAGSDTVLAADDPAEPDRTSTPDAPATEPDAPIEPGTTSESDQAPFQAQIVKQGEFAGADSFHFGEGTALLIETGTDAYTLRLEDFSVRNGPDLFVFLSPDPNGYTDNALELGTLKGTDGAFNYEIPTGTDVSQFQSAVIWCKAFAVLFATAPLA